LQNAALPLYRPIKAIGSFTEGLSGQENKRAEEDARSSSILGDGKVLKAPVVRSQSLLPVRSSMLKPPAPSVNKYRYFLDFIFIYSNNVH